jgi:hypothetical protein
LSIGALLIIGGCFIELVIPGLIWQFGARGKLYRILQNQIKSGRRLGHVREWDIQRNWAKPGFPLSKWTTNLIRCAKGPDRQGFGRGWGGAEVARRWVRGKNSPLSSRSMAG